MPKYTTIIFDMDGVVVDTEKVYMKADFEFLKRHGTAYKLEEIKDLLVGREIKEGTRVLKEKYNFTGDLETLYGERKSLLDQSFQNNIGFIPGFLDFYRQIKELGFKTCIATSSNDDFLKMIDQKLGLFKLFENKVFGISKVENKSKPDPAIFLFAAKETGSLPEECVVIEDSPRGIEAAKRANMFCVGLGTTFETQKIANADIVVKSYGEIDIKIL
ncbi:MAG: HAD family phosphatase [Candidatus Doudnabacteria bacterium]|nr:HAD family phosphatase [Candidatus Doudnabacteria bacterium]